MKATVSGAHEDGDVGSREHRLEHLTWRHAVEIKCESHTHAIERRVGAFRVHPSRKMENLTWMLSSDTKQLLGGPTRHEARRAAASSLLLVVIELSGEALTFSQQCDELYGGERGGAPCAKDRL